MRVHLPVSVCSALTCLFVCGGCKANPPETRYADLILDQVASWNLGPLAEFHAGAVLDGGRVVATFRNGTARWFEPGEAVPFAEHHTDPLYLITPDYERSGASVQAVSLVSGNIVELSAPGDVVPSNTSCPAARDAVALAAGPGILLAVFPERERNRHRVVLFGLSNGRQCLGRDTTYVACDQGNPSLAAFRAQATFLGCAHPGKPLFSVRILNDSELLLREIEESTPPAPDQLGGLWYGLPIVRTDEGLLRVVSDLRNERRRVERWDQYGRHVTTTELNWPLGTVASLPEHRYLLIARGGSPAKLVLYKWSWVPGNISR
jgi:hypothetical protein